MISSVSVEASDIHDASPSSCNKPISILGSGSKLSVVAQTAGFVSLATFTAAIVVVNRTKIRLYGLKSRLG